MKIINLEPAASHGGGMRTIALFDLELTDEVRLYGLRLLEASDGHRVVYAAQSGSRRTATFSRAVAGSITELASNELEAVTAHGINSTAA